MNIKPPAHYHYILLNKPYGMLCQFTDRVGRATLADLGSFPKDVYPVGRLDFDSEGLVLLTNNGRIQRRLSEPTFRHPRTYLVQVERIPSDEALRKLREGILLEKKKTLPASVRLLEHEPSLPQRTVPIRFRKSVPTAWLEITLYEGRNRQVRKMTAAIGYPTLRLVRIRIGDLSLAGLQPGEHRHLSASEVAKIELLLTG